MKPYYEDDLTTLYQGDCLDVMRTLPADSFDLVFTSPPYNLGNNSGFAKPGNKTGKWTGGPLAQGYSDHDDALPHAEYVAWQRAVLTECWRLLKPSGAIFYNHKPRVQFGKLQTPLDLNPGLPLRQIIVWDRGSGMNFTPTHYVPMHEWIAVFASESFRLAPQGSGFGDVWRILPETRSKHPAPFPLALPARAIASTGAKSVFDPFSGSGTVLRAAKDAAIRGVGIELTEAYCAMTVDRLGQQAFDLEGIV